MESIAVYREVLRPKDKVARSELNQPTQSKLSTRRNKRGGTKLPRKISHATEANLYQSKMASKS